MRPFDCGIPSGCLRKRELHWLRFLFLIVVTILKLVMHLAFSVEVKPVAVQSTPERVVRRPPSDLSAAAPCAGRIMRDG